MEKVHEPVIKEILQSQDLWLVLDEIRKHHHAEAHDLVGLFRGRHRISHQVRDDRPEILSPGPRQATRLPAITSDLFPGQGGGVVTHSSIPPSTLSWMICAAVCLITSRSSKTRNVPRRARKLLFVRNAAMNSGLMEHVERMLRRHKSTSLRTRLWWADASGRVAKSPTKVSSRDASRSRAADTGKKRSAYRR